MTLLLEAGFFFLFLWILILSPEIILNLLKIKSICQKLPSIAVGSIFALIKAKLLKQILSSYFFDIPFTFLSQARFPFS